MKFLSMTVEGKSAIVTGAGRGLGKMMSLALANAGADLVLASNEADNNEVVAKQIMEMGGKAISVTMDVNRTDDLIRMREECINAYGKIDILVNNAGISPVYNRAEHIREDILDSILQTNFRAVFICSQIIGEVMREQKHGKIINIASSAGMEGSPRIAAYAASKAAVINLTRTLAVEWAPYNINVNAVAPGFFEIGLGEPMLSNEEIKKEVISHIPLGRLGLKEEICGAAVFLASDAANYITGNILMVDGGWAA